MQIVYEGETHSRKRDGKCKDPAVGSGMLEEQIVQHNKRRLSVVWLKSAQDGLEGGLVK